MAIRLGDAVVFIKGNLDELNRDLGRGEQQTKGWAQRLGSSVNSALGTGIKMAAGAAAGGVAALAGTMATATMKASSLEGIQNTFYDLADGAKLAEMQSASLNMVLDADLMETYNRAAIAVSKSFADDLPNAMQHMGKIVGATGEDMGYLLESYQFGIARLSPMILDNLGIQVNLAEANEAYAESIGVAVDELSKEEEQLALTQQVQELLAEKTADMGDHSDSAAVKLAQLKTMAGNLFVELGQVGLPVLTELVRPLVDLAQTYGPQASEVLERLTGVMTMVVGELQAGVDPLTVFSYVLEELGVPPDVIATFQKIAGAVGDFIGKASSFAQEHGPAIQGALAGIGVVLAGAGIALAVAAIGAAIAALATPITAIIAVVALLGAAWATNWGGIQDKTRAVMQVITKIFNRTFAVWKSVFAAFGAAFRGDWSAFGEHLRAAWDQSWDNIISIVRGGIDAIRSINWGEIGSSIIQGIANGIRNAAGFVADAARAAAEAAYEAAKGFLGIESPSTLFEALGRYSMAGMAQGVERAAAAPVRAVQQATARMTQVSLRNSVSVGPVTMRNDMDVERVARRIADVIGEETVRRMALVGGT